VNTFLHLLEPVVGPAVLLILLAVVLGLVAGWRISSKASLIDFAIQRLHRCLHALGKTTKETDVRIEKKLDRHMKDFTNHVENEREIHSTLDRGLERIIGAMEGKKDKNGG